MNPEELDKELDRLWARVSAPGTEPPSPASADVGGLTREITIDTISLLKRQHEQQVRSWTEMVEGKERALRAALDRLRAAEAELQRLRQKALEDDELRVADTLEAHAKLQAGQKAIELERQAHAEEQRVLQELLQGARARLSDEIARAQDLRRQWDKREQQYLSDLKDLQSLAARQQAEAGEAQEEARRRGDSIKEAKNALEKTLSELLLERKVRAEAEKEREAALKKVDEVEKHFAELSKLWEEERSQWRELWDRERSTWEAQRAEFSTWEQSLRQERQKWHAELEAKEKSQIDFVAQVNETLRQSAETSSKVAATLKILRGLASAGQSSRRVMHRFSGVMLAAAAAAVLLAGAVPAFRWLSKPRLTVVSVEPIALKNPTGLAYDGNLLIVPEFDGRIEYFDPKNLGQSFRGVDIPGVSPYHPAGLAFGGEDLWTLDSAQARLLRHRAADPAQVIVRAPSPGPAPSALAYDGKSLWSYDAANRALYRHAAQESQAQAYALEGDALPSALAWVGQLLWVFDAKSRDVLVYRKQGERFALAHRVALGETALGAAAVGEGRGRQLWILAGPTARRSGIALVKFRY